MKNIERKMIKDLSKRTQKAVKSSLLWGKLIAKKKGNGSKKN